MLSRVSAHVVRRGGNSAQQARSLGASIPVILLQARSFGASIPVILLEDMDQGREGEIVRVKRGFMRNYLAPRKKACYVTDENKATHASLLEKALAYEKGVASKAGAKAEAKVELAEKLAGVNEIVATAATIDDTDNLYGGISAKDIVGLLKEQHDIVVNENNVKLGAKVESTGIYKVDVAGVQLQLVVVAQEE